MAPYSSCKWEHTRLKTEQEVAQWNFIPQHEVLKVSYSKDSHCIQVININTIYNQSVQDQSLHHTFFISWRQKKSDLWTISQNWALVAGSQPGWLSPRFKVEFCLLLLQSLLPSKPNTLQQFEKHITGIKQFNSIIHTLGGLVSMPDNLKWPGLRLQLQYEVLHTTYCLQVKNSPDAKYRLIPQQIYMLPVCKFLQKHYR